MDGNYAYVADGTTGLTIIDISDPTNLNLASSYLTTTASNVPPSDIISVFILDDYAYMSNEMSGLGLEIIDISNKTTPSKVGEIIPTNGNTTYKLFVVDNYCYAPSLAGLNIIDVSDKTNPSMGGVYHGEGFTYSVFVSGNYAYLTDLSQGLHKIDITEKSAPILEDKFQDLNNPYDVFVSGNYAYVADFDEGLKIFRIE